MAVQLKIKVTKEILELSTRCGAEETEMIVENCAVTLALKDIFPEVVVTGQYYPSGIDENNTSEDLKIEMPKIAQDFIAVFDSLYAMQDQRLLLPEFEFEISIPDEIISQLRLMK